MIAEYMSIIIVGIAVEIISVANLVLIICTKEIFQGRHLGFENCGIAQGVASVTKLFLNTIPPSNSVRSKKVRVLMYTRGHS